MLQAHINGIIGVLVGGVASLSARHRHSTTRSCLASIVIEAASFKAFGCVSIKFSGILLLVYDDELKHVLVIMPFQSRSWQRSLMRAIRLVFPKPETSMGIPAMLLGASGRPLTDQLPPSPWLKAFLSELREQWGFARGMEMDLSQER